MKTYREEENGEGQEYSKSQKLIGQSSSPSPSPSPPWLGFDDALLPLASYADDEDGEEDDERRGACGVRVGNYGGRIEQNDHDDGSEYDDEDEDDDDHVEKGPSQEKRNRAFEVWRDCPYLDTVNRQVYQGTG